MGREGLASASREASMSEITAAIYCRVSTEEQAIDRGAAKDSR